MSYLNGLTAQEQQPSFVGMQIGFLDFAQLGYMQIGQWLVSVIERGAQMRFGRANFDDLGPRGSEQAHVLRFRACSGNPPRAEPYRLSPPSSGNVRRQIHPNAHAGDPRHSMA